MIKVKHIFREDIDELVRLSYEGDTELFEKYHFREGMSFEQCVKENIDAIDETAKTVDFDYYKLSINETAIGYLVTFPKCLYSFAIGIKWRTKEILISVFEKIVDVLGNQFACILYKNNKRVIGWLLKCGMEEHETGLDDNSISLTYCKI